MPGLTPEQIRGLVATFVPKALADNVFVKALMAGAAAAGILLATPAFAPVGVVGATGWLIVYIVTGGTFTFEVAQRAWRSWRRLEDGRRQAVDHQLESLKDAFDRGMLDEQEYKRRARGLLDELLGGERG